MSVAKIFLLGLLGLTTLGCTRVEKTQVVRSIATNATLMRPTTKPHFSIEVDPFYHSLQSNIAIINCLFLDDLSVGVGTAFPIGEDKNNYYLLTDLHVLSFIWGSIPESQTGVSIPEIQSGIVMGGFPLGTFPVVAYSSPELDLALVRVPKTRATFTETFKLVESNLPPIGSEVTMVGNPHNYIAAVSRSTICRYYEENGRLYINTVDMARQGSSGAFLVTKDKRVIGILQKVHGHNLSISLSAREIRMWLDSCGYDFLGK